MQHKLRLRRDQIHTRLPRADGHYLLLGLPRGMSRIQCHLKVVRGLQLSG